MYSRFSAAVRFSEPPLGTRFRALGAQPCAPTPKSWLRIPGVDRQRGRLRPRRRVHTSEPRRESADASYHAAWKARKEAGRVRALAVTTATRSGALPEVPAVAESVPGFEASTWQGIGAPKNTSGEIVDRLNKEINAALADPKIKARLADLGSANANVA